MKKCERSERHRALQSGAVARRSRASTFPSPPARMPVPPAASAQLRHDQEVHESVVMRKRKTATHCTGRSLPPGAYFQSRNPWCTSKPPHLTGMHRSSRAPGVFVLPALWCRGRSPCRCPPALVGGSLSRWTEPVHSGHGSCTQQHDTRQQRHCGPSPPTSHRARGSLHFRTAQQVVMGKSVPPRPMPIVVAVLPLLPSTSSSAGVKGRRWRAFPP